MTYQQAIELVKTIDELIVDSGFEFQILIAPSNQTDFARFVADYRIYEFTNKSCLRYSTNKQFEIYGFCIYGNDVLYQHISKFQRQ